MSLALVVATVVLAFHLKGSSIRTRQWFGHLTSATAVMALAAAIAALRRWAIRTVTAADRDTRIPGLVVGKDNRVSTSKISALAWTLALGWAVLSLLVANWAGAPGGWHNLASEGIKDEYLVLLGGPFAALIGAAAIVRAKLASGALVKTSAEEPSVAQAFTDDTGQTDLVDSQYLFFGAIALLAFIVQFIREAGDGLPQLPPFLVALASAGTTAYVLNKAARDDQPPSVVRVSPDRGVGGAPVTVVGRNLLPGPGNAVGTPATGATVVRVLFGSVEVPIDITSAAATRGDAGYDRIAVNVPALPGGVQPPQDVDVSVENVLGVASSNTVTFKILAP